MRKTTVCFGLLVVCSQASADDDLVIANASRGEALWRQACPVNEIDGVCAKLVVRTAPKHGIVQCGPAGRARLAIVPRDAQKVRDAIAAFKRATDDFEHRPRTTGADAADLVHAYALAKLLDADRDFEAFLQLELPANLMFDPDPTTKPLNDPSILRFETWLKQKTAASADLTAKLEFVVALPDPAAIAAAARIGQIQLGFSDALLTAPLPVLAQRSEDTRDAFCDRMLVVAEPFAQRAVDAFAVCLAKSNQLAELTESSKVCERELSLLRPMEYPLSSELHTDVNRVSPIIDVEPPPPAKH